MVLDYKQCIECGLANPQLTPEEIKEIADKADGNIVGESERSTLVKRDIINLY